MKNKITLTFKDEESCAWALRTIKTQMNMGTGHQLSGGDLGIMLECLGNLSEIDSSMTPEEAYQVRMGNKIKV